MSKIVAMTNDKLSSLLMNWKTFFMEFERYIFFSRVQLLLMLLDLACYALTRPIKRM